MRRAIPWLMCSLLVLTAAACGSSSDVRRDNGAREYRDPAGWTVDVPKLWRVVRFSKAKAVVGAEISNVRLPPPTPLPGYPIQVNGYALPPRGIALVIARDRDPGSGDVLAVPPLPQPGGSNNQWTIGSSLPGEPYIEILWFKASGATFIASVKVGPSATGTDLNVLDRIIQSLRVEPTRHQG
jgi:hypothetical protein